MTKEEIDKIKELAYNEGREKGREEGYDEGYDAGYIEGQNYLSCLFSLLITGIRKDLDQALKND